MSDTARSEFIIRNAFFWNTHFQDNNFLPMNVKKLSDKDEKHPFVLHAVPGTLSDVVLQHIEAPLSVVVRINVANKLFFRLSTNDGDQQAFFCFEGIDSVKSRIIQSILQSGRYAAGELPSHIFFGLYSDVDAMSPSHIIKLATTDPPPLSKAEFGKSGPKSRLQHDPRRFLGLRNLGRYNCMHTISTSLNETSFDRVNMPSRFVS
jgi:hypothetical protein